MSIKMNTENRKKYPIMLEQRTEKYLQKQLDVHFGIFVILDREWNVLASGRVKLASK